MRQIDLQEHRTSGPIALTADERDRLQEVLPSVAVEPAAGRGGRYHLRPGSVVGALEVGGLSVHIAPKMGIPRMLSLVCYATKVYRPQEENPFVFLEAEALPDILALTLAATARRAFTRGLLRGYRTVEEALHTVRGRVRIAEQLRRRYGRPLPVELRFDEFTEDILANRLVKAAAVRLGRATLRSSGARRGVSWIAATLEDVALRRYRARAVPEVRFDRLNEHYRHVVGLARLVLRHGAFRAERGEVRAAGFLMDMNRLFQEFVTAALREALGVSARTLRADDGAAGVALDEAGVVQCRPDLSWWEDDGRCSFVGDAKYKNVAEGAAPNADLYQMLAYCTALDLPGGLLVYARGEADAATHQVRHAGKRLEVFALDLSGTLDETLESIRVLAGRVQALRAEALRMAPAVQVATPRRMAV